MAMVASGLGLQEDAYLHDSRNSNIEAALMSSADGICTDTLAEQ